MVKAPMEGVYMPQLPLVMPNNLAVFFIYLDSQRKSHATTVLDKHLINATIRSLTSLVLSPRDQIRPWLGL